MTEQETWGTLRNFAITAICYRIPLINQNCRSQDPSLERVILL